MYYVWVKQGMCNLFIVLRRQENIRETEESIHDEWFFVCLCILNGTGQNNAFLIIYGEVNESAGS